MIETYSTLIPDNNSFDDIFTNIWKNKRGYI